jgi:uncharacterized membrane protein YphA (DoxX/SURF4 family)
MLYLFILGRILLGGYFIMSGWNHFQHHGMLTGYAQSKGVMMPGPMVWLTGLMMFLGGVGILWGIYVVYSIYLLAIFLIITTLKMHQYWKVTDQMSRMGEEINFKKNLALLGAVLMLLAIPLPWIMTLF